ncbi:hypothetical protein Tco_0633777 [Tanacetum coccineum]
MLWNIHCSAGVLKFNLFAAIQIHKQTRKETSRKLDINYVKIQFRGGLLGIYLYLLVPTGRFPAAYDISPGLKDLSRAETYKRERKKENIRLVKLRSEQPTLSKAWRGVFIS